MSRDTAENIGIEQLAERLRQVAGLVASLKQRPQVEKELDPVSAQGRMD